MVVSNHARFSLSFLQIMPMTFYEVIIVGFFFHSKFDILWGDSFPGCWL